MLCFALFIKPGLINLSGFGSYYISDFQNTHQPPPPLDLNPSGVKCLFSRDHQVGLSVGALLPTTVSDPVQEAHENVEYAV